MSTNSANLIVNNQVATSAYVSSGGEMILGRHSTKRVSPNNGVQSSFVFGSQYISFQIQRGSPQEFLADARIYIQIGPITGGTSSTYAYLVNAGAVYMFEWFRLFSNTQEVAVVSSDQVFQNMYKYVDSDVWSRLSTDIGYNTSTTARQASAQGNQSFCIPLKYLFNHFQKPIDISTYGDLELRLYLKNNINYCVQQNGTTTASFSFLNAWLDLLYTNTPSNIVKASRDLLLSGKSPQHYDINYIIQNFTLSAGQTQYVLDVSSTLYQQNVIDISILCRLASNINTNYTSDYTDNNQAIYSFNIKSSDIYINNLQQDMIVAQDYQHIILPRMHLPGIQQIENMTNPAIMMSFASDDEQTNVEKSGWKYRGSLIFDQYKNTQITLNFSAALTASVIASVMVRTARLCENKNGQLFVF